MIYNAISEEQKTERMKEYEAGHSGNGIYCEGGGAPGSFPCTGNQDNGYFFPPPPQGIIKKQIHRTGGPEMTYTAAVITVSDSTSMGQRTDTSGPAICSMLEEAGYSGIHTAHRAG